MKKSYLLLLAALLFCQPLYAGPIFGGGSSGSVSDGDKGDITVSSSGTAWGIDADAVRESDLKAVDSPSDEECLTYETTTGDFEWQTCSGTESNNLETVTTGIQTTEIPIGTAADTVVYAALSGDVTMTNGGVVTIGADKVALGTDTTGNYAGSASEGGAATTAIALAANGSNCSSGSAPLGVDASGAAESCGVVANAAGRSLTMSSSSTEADSELYTDSKCVWIETPTSSDDLKSVWISNGFASTITKLWCESDQTVTTMLQVDDGSPADVDSVDLSCTSTPATDTSLNGDATLADGDRLDVDIASTSGTPTWVSLCWTYTKDD